MLFRQFNLFFSKLHVRHQDIFNHRNWLDESITPLRFLFTFQSTKHSSLSHSHFSNHGTGFVHLLTLHHIWGFVKLISLFFHVIFYLFHFKSCAHFGLSLVEEIVHVLVHFLGFLKNLLLLNYHFFLVLNLLGVKLIWYLL